MKNVTGIVETKIEMPDQLFELFQKLNNKGYIFRGQSNGEWPLATSLERSINRFCPEYIGVIENREHWMLHAFKSKSHLYSMHSIHTPQENDHVEWLAIMQHFGCPTRLLDFTDSPHIATYFAVHDAASDAAVWALDWWTMRDKLQRRFELGYEPMKTLRDEVNRRHLELANKYIANQSLRGPDACPLSLIPITPQKFTDRISRQQGLFITPTNAQRPFMENLTAVYNLGTDAYEKIEQVKFDALLTKDFMEEFVSSARTFAIKLILPLEHHRSILSSLRQMNVTAETLFGGIDGLAKSLVQTVLRS